MRRLIATSLAFVTLLGLGGCERWSLDQKMDELCKKDGGIKVYEEVTLPASDFSNTGEPLGKYIPLAKSVEDYLGPDYRYVVRKDVLVGAQANLENGHGRLERIHEIVYRRADNQMLGESIWYARGGGDGFTFGFQPSGDYCPKPTVGLFGSIFVRGK